MPLSFSTRNRGDIAFGFFNIESDMLLLEQYFFFADRFCRWMVDLAGQKGEPPVKIEPEVHVIRNPMDIGDLMGAIHGFRFTGFIGRLYRIFPFPEDPEKFKQNPDGFQTRDLVEQEIRPFAEKKRLPIVLGPDETARIGPFVFTRPVFHDLIRYVWEGGYPKWKDGIRPACVRDMKDGILAGENSFFKGVFES